MAVTDRSPRRLRASKFHTPAPADSSRRESVPQPCEHPAFTVKVFVDAEAKCHDEDGSGGQAQNRPGQPRAIADRNRRIWRRVVDIAMDMARSHAVLLRSPRPKDTGAGG